MNDFREYQEEAISIHIFSVSAAMVGVCLTVVGIINIVTSHLRIKTLADDLTALGALIFLAACSISYFAIKMKRGRRKLILEKVSDVIFLIGLAVLALICVILVITLNKTL
jgi:hypothetical protein